MDIVHAASELWGNQHPAIRFLIGAIFGAIVGSYIATIAIRLPQGLSSVSGRSRCDHCNVELASRDLLPLLGYWLNRGKCRNCGGKIDLLHQGIEWVAALLCGCAFTLSSLSSAFPVSLFMLLLVLLAALDFRHFWLPNKVVMLLAIAGLLLGGLAFGTSLMDRLIGGIAGFASLFAVAWCYEKARGRKGMGGGDPKLLGAIGLWLGWAALPIVVLIGASLAITGTLVTTPRQKLARDTRLPFGAYLSLGSLAFSVWMMM